MPRVFVRVGESPMKILAVGETPDNRTPFPAATRASVLIFPTTRSLCRPREIQTIRLILCFGIILCSLFNVGTLLYALGLF